MKFYKQGSFLVIVPIAVLMCPFGLTEWGIFISASLWGLLIGIEED